MWSNPPLHLGVEAIEKGAFWLPLTTVAKKYRNGIWIEKCAMLVIKTRNNTLRKESNYQIK